MIKQVEKRSIESKDSNQNCLAMTQSGSMRGRGRIQKFMWGTTIHESPALVAEAGARCNSEPFLTC